ncbi:MAG TPA: hypothetical protein VF485_16835 [Sphingomonas sp.]
MRDAWRLWRHDWELLTAVGGLFMFLPALAIAMLIPDMPLPPASDQTAPGSVTMVVYEQGLTQWMVHYGGWQLAAQAIVLFGQFAIVALYLSGDQPAASKALKAAARRYPFLLLAGLIIAVPIAAALLLAQALPLLMAGFFVLVFWVLARTIALAPTLLAEAPVGALGAITRSLHLTRGNTLALAAAVMTVILAMTIATWPFEQIDAWMLVHAPNPIARAIIDAIAAMITGLGGIAMSLVQVAAYRQLRTR